MAAGRGGTERAAPAPMHGAEEAAGAAGGPRARAVSTQTDSMAGERGCTAARPGWRLSPGRVCVEGVCAAGGEGGRAKWLPALWGCGVSPTAGTEPYSSATSRGRGLSASPVGAVGFLVLPSPACFPSRGCCVWLQGAGPQICGGKVAPLGGERGSVGG